jgi:uncharacterized membrane protein YfcA
MVDLVLFVVLVLIGLGVGFVASMVGVGGGVFIVPTLTLGFLFSLHNAVGTSLVVVLFTALAGAFAYYRQKRIDFKVGLILSASSVPGAIAGAYLTSFITSQQLTMGFAVFLVLIAIKMMVNFKGASKFSKMWGSWDRSLTDSEGRKFEYTVNVALVFFFAFFGGLSSGLLGIGGGALMVPILSIVGNLPMHITVATSMFMMIFASSSGVVSHVQLGNVNFEFAAFLALGVVVGSQIGARVAKKVSAKWLRRIFAVVLIIVSINMFFESI